MLSNFCAFHFFFENLMEKLNNFQKSVNVDVETIQKTWKKLNNDFCKKKKIFLECLSLTSGKFKDVPH